MRYDKINVAVNQSNSTLVVSGVNSDIGDDDGPGIHTVMGKGSTCPFGKDTEGVSTVMLYPNKKAVLSQGNRAMPQMFFSV